MLCLYKISDSAFLMVKFKHIYLITYIAAFSFH